MLVTKKVPRPLIYSVYHNNLEGVKLLLRSKADPNQTDEHHRGALFYALATEKINYKIVKLLLDAGADPNLKKALQSLPSLYFTIAGSDLRVARLLIKAKADVNATLPARLSNNAEGITLLIYASGAGKYNFAKLLLENKADPHKQDKQGSTPLSYSQSILDRIDQLRKDPSKQENLGKTERKFLKNSKTLKVNLKKIIQLLKRYTTPKNKAI